MGSKFSAEGKAYINRNKTVFVMCQCVNCPKMIISKRKLIVRDDYGGSIGTNKSLTKVLASIQSSH
jgi:hypothetical protein